MAKNIFMTESAPLGFEDYLRYDEESRGNLGDELPVLVYRMLEYSLKSELVKRFGKETQIEVFRSAGRTAGEYFARRVLDLNQPLDQFVSELQTKLEELKIGVLRIEEVDEESGRIILTVAEDADCSGLPVLGETVCNYEEGFIAGILSVYSGKVYTAVEVDCWATGDRVCRFHADVEQQTGG
ncbi:MAG: 4-vinyl reductase [Lachnospiraceae bacterium]|nr:4-vinyl reductase [Lachnospiraceae bacterium]